jgi:hypothetical protein
MQASRFKEIIDHAEVLFKPELSHLRDRHEADLRDARFKARKTGNGAAMLPAEAACFVAHAKALVAAKAIPSGARATAHRASSLARRRRVQPEVPS